MANKAILNVKLSKDVSSSFSHKVDDDVTLAANSDVRIPTQKAVKAWVETETTHMPTSDMDMLYLGTPTYTTLRDWINLSSAGFITAGTITSNGDGSCSVGAGTGLIKTEDLDYGELRFFDWAADDDVSLTNNATNWLYIDYNAGSPIVAVTTDISSLNLHTQIVFGRVYRKDNDLDILNGLGQDVDDYMTEACYKDFEVYGFQRASGMITTEDGTRYLDVTAGIGYCAHNRYTCSAQNTNTGGDTFTYVYRANGGGWTYDDNGGAGYTQVSNILYDDGDGTPGDVDNNKYATYYVYQTFGDCKLFVQMGQTQDHTLAEAQEETVPTPPDRLSNFALLIAKIIIEKGATNFAEITNPFNTIFMPATPVNHNDLGGIQGGSADSYYHLTGTQHTDLTDAGDSALHYHSSDRARANHTGTQLAATISDFDEAAQDAVGTILVDSSEIDFTYTDGTPSITASIKTGSIDVLKLDAGVQASLGLADSAVQPAALSAYATTELDNLGTTAINTSLISDTDATDDLGSSAISWKDLYIRTIKINGSTSGTVTIQGAADAGTHTITLPTADGTNGQVLQTNGNGVWSWVDNGGGGVSGASQALDNLASVAINTSLISDTNNTDDIGSIGIRWKKGWFVDMEITNLPTIGGSSLASKIKLDDLATPDDNTDLDVSTSRHGLVPKAPNILTKFLRGDGTWDVPIGGPSYWEIIITPTRSDTDTFTCTTTANANINNIISKGTVVRWEESGTQKVAVIESTSFSSPTLTVNIKGDSMASIDTNTLEYSLLKAEKLTWAIAGSIDITGTDVANINIAQCEYRALAFQIFAGTAGNGTTTIDVNDDGTSITSTKSSITTTNTEGSMVASTSTIAEDSVLTIDIDAKASTTPVTDLYCYLYVIETGKLYVD